MQGWVRIWSGQNLQRVALIKHLLESNEIPVIQLNKQDSSYLFGEMEILVKHDDAVRARHLLERNASGDE